MATSWTPDHDTRLKTLHASGESLRACARQLGFAQSTVSKHGTRLGLTWDRSQTEAATVAKTADNRARRAALSARFLDEVEAALDDLDGPALVYRFGGKENLYSQSTIDQARLNPESRQRLLTSAAIAVDKHRILEQIDGDPGVEAGRSLLAGLADAFGLTDPQTPPST